MPSNATGAAPVKGVGVEVWVVGCDPEGVWLMDGTAVRRSDLVRLGQRAHDLASALVADVEDLAVLHSTSWRDDRDEFTHTYLAAVNAVDAFVLEEWPDAIPVDREAIRSAGKPYQNGATERPRPRYSDVASHGVRHLAWLVKHDDAIRKALDETWHRYLADLEPALAVMYTSEQAA